MFHMSVCMVYNFVRICMLIVLTKNIKTHLYRVLFEIPHSFCICGIFPSIKIKKHTTTTTTLTATRVNGNSKNAARVIFICVYLATLKFSHANLFISAEINNNNNNEEDDKKKNTESDHISIEEQRQQKPWHRPPIFAKRTVCLMNSLAVCLFICSSVSL